MGNLLFSKEVSEDAEDVEGSRSSLEEVVQG